MGGTYLTGPDRNTWEDPHDPDLVLMRPPGNGDLLSGICLTIVVQAYHRSIGRYFRVGILRGPLLEKRAYAVQKPNSPFPGDRTVYYSEVGTGRVVSVITILLSSILPASAIAVLYSISSMQWRLGTMGIFSGVFSACLALVTNGKPVEIFAATSAYVGSSS